MGGLVELFEQRFELGAAAVGEVGVLGAIFGDEGAVFFNQTMAELGGKAGLRDIEPLDLPISTSNLFVVAGPRTVKVRQLDFNPLVFSYRLKVNGEVATANVASQVVVIPQNATAPADIILESSTDLITWIAALPGSYSPAGSNRFFRVRLVTH